MPGNASQTGAYWEKMLTRNLGQMFPKPKFSWTSEYTSGKKSAPNEGALCWHQGVFFSDLLANLQESTRIEFERIRKVQRKLIRPASIFTNGNEV